jgi:cell division protein ZapA (FtsZ GTPase activity inhibitor)
MKSIQVQIGGHNFPMKVREEEEQNMRSIADYVNKKILESKVQLKTMQEQLVLIHACLSVAEDLFELRKKQPDESFIEERTLNRVNGKFEQLLGELDG